MQTVEIAYEPIELFKLLKFQGIAMSGGEAKTLIAEGQVKVNGQAETQKRKKLVSGDCIECLDARLTLSLIEATQ